MVENIKPKLKKLINFSYRNQAYLLDLCRPLDNFFNIKQFSYYHVKNCGATMLLNSFPKHLENYIINEHYLIDPHVVHPNNMKDGKLFWSIFEDMKFQGIYMFFLRNYYNLDHGLTLVRKSNTSYEAFSFTTYTDNTSIYNKYFNHLNFLEAFVDQFNIHLFDDFSSYYVDMNDLKHDSFLTQNGITSHCHVEKKPFDITNYISEK